MSSEQFFKCKFVSIVERTSYFLRWW